MQIREFRSQDAPAVVNLVRETLQASNTHDYPQRIIERMTNYFDEEFFLQHAKNEPIYVAEKDGSIVGVARLDGNVITTLFVHPDVQGQGVGSALLDHFEGLARKQGINEVSVYGSLTAVEFFEQHGYEQQDVAIHKTFGTNAVMHKLL